MPEHTCRALPHSQGMKVDQGGGIYDGNWSAMSMSMSSLAASIEMKQRCSTMPPCCRETDRVAAGDTRGCCCRCADEVAGGGAITGFLDALASGGSCSFDMDGAGGGISGDAQTLGASCRCDIDGASGGCSDDAPDPGASWRCNTGDVRDGLSDRAPNAGDALITGHL